MDPEMRLRGADEFLTRATAELESLLQEAARSLRPFPPFPGAFFTFGVEVEPSWDLDETVGCVVVSETGELKELQIGMDHDAMEMLDVSDPVTMRAEQLTDLTLSPRDRLLYTLSGLRTITALLRERDAGPASS